MKATTVTTSFASTHRDEAESPYLHGHSFFVSVTELGLSVNLLHDLREVATELHLHSLDDMLVAGGQDLESMAAWFMERLLLRHPRISQVEMWLADAPDEHTSVRREIR